MKELVVSIINSILTVKCDISEIEGNPEDAIEIAAGPDHVKPTKQKFLPKLKVRSSYNVLVFILVETYDRFKFVNNKEKSNAS